MITWTQSLEAMYGVQLTDAQVPVWEHYLKKEGTNSRELVPAIEAAAENNVKPIEWRVTTRDLIRWVKMHRVKNFNPDTSLGAYEQKFIAEWIKRLADGATVDDFTAALLRQPVKLSVMQQIEKEVLK